MYTIKLRDSCHLSLHFTSTLTMSRFISSSVSSANDCHDDVIRTRIRDEKSTCASSRSHDFIYYTLFLLNFYRKRFLVSPESPFPRTHQKKKITRIVSITRRSCRSSRHGIPPLNAAAGLSASAVASVRVCVGPRTLFPLYSIYSCALLRMRARVCRLLSLAHSVTMYIYIYIYMEIYTLYIFTYIRIIYSRLTLQNIVSQCVYLRYWH